MKESASPSTQDEPYQPILPDSPAGESARRVLRYWFGERQSPQQDGYHHNGNLWFRSDSEQDALTHSLFAEDVEEAAAGDLDELQQTPHGLLALVLLLHQLPLAIYRGTSGMFAHESLAQGWAMQAIETGWDTQLAPVERLFLYTALHHAEDKELAQLGVNKIAALLDVVPDAQRGRFVRMHKFARQYLEIIEMFGRNPYRNALLQRTSTPAEEAFLQGGQYRSSQPAPLGQMSKPQSTPGADFQVQRRLRILVLHGFRQNARLLRSRTKQMRQRLGDLVEFVYANGPLPCVLDGNTQSLQDATQAALGQTMDTEHQRCWWNATDDHTQYRGFDVSIAFLSQMVKMHGPFDGILGFSQGAALAGLLAAMKPFDLDTLRFVICISGFPSSVHEHQSWLAPASIDLPSFHLVGANDLLVAPARTIRFSQCFQSPVVVEHSGGHFVPARWPLDAFRDFLMDFVDAKVDPCLRDASAFDALSWPQQVGLLADTSTPLNLLPKLVSAPMQRRLEDAAFRQMTETISSGNVPSVAQFVAWLQRQQTPAEAPIEELMTVAWALRATAQGQESFAHCLLALQLVESPALAPLLAEIPKVGDWSDLVALAVANAAYREAASEAESLRLEALHQAIVAMFVAQLRADDALLQQTLDGSSDDEAQWPSECARHAPKPRYAVDKKCHLGKDIARALFPLHQPDPTASPEVQAAALSYTKQICYRLYYKMLQDLRLALDHLSLDFSDRQIVAMRKQRYQQSHQLMQQGDDEPLPLAITHPAPEPVLPSSRQEIAPLLASLKANRPVAELTQFARGSLLPDGRLDLCKQVVGPAGIHPLLDSMKHNHHVTGLLLGNNIVGDDGAKAIAEYIQSGDSRLDIWYIAGNELTAAGLQWITDALAKDTQVRHLWLKRNPLGVAGGKPLGELLSRNQTLEVLDLNNCGLLDEGIRDVLEGLAHNTSIRHLYLDANGISAKGAAAIARYLLGGSKLQSLFLSCNRIGPAGAKILAEGLAQDTTLERFSLSSNRIGPLGAKAICGALRNHPTLMHLDLGFMRGTTALGEAPNFLGDEGAEAVAQLLSVNSTLRSVDLLHNDITQDGLVFLRDALRDNHTLLQLHVTQFQRSRKNPVREDIGELLARNKANASASELAHADDKVFLPNHIKEVYSVYRTS